MKPMSDEPENPVVSRHPSCVIRHPSSELANLAHDG